MADYQIKKKNILYFILKRFFDIVFSFIFLMLFIPLSLILCLAIVIDSKGNPFYVSTRIGKNGKPFKFFKFRTMVKYADKQKESLNQYNEADEVVFKIKNDPRITKIGRFLRKSSLDELPQLLNILIGNMSFVGPRPPLPEEVKQYDDFAKLRLLAKPGLTCIWQCSGRTRIKFEEWMKMDYEYLNKRSLFFDFWLILKTIPAVFKGDGAY